MNYAGIGFVISSITVLLFGIGVVALEENGFSTRYRYCRHTLGANRWFSFWVAFIDSVLN